MMGVKSLRFVAIAAFPEIATYLPNLLF